MPECGPRTRRGGACNLADAAHPVTALKTAPISLTQREREVAGLVAEGLTNREIATKLFISERTAEYHLEQIRNKLGFHSRAQIAVWMTAQAANRGRVDPARVIQARSWPRARRLSAVLAVTAIAATGVAIAALAINRSAVPVASPVDSVIQIDDGTGRLIGTIPTDARGSQLAFGEGYLWEISYSARTLMRIDPHSRAVVTTKGVPVGAPPIGLAVGAHWVWVVMAFGEKSLWRFDPATNQWSDPIGLGTGLAGIAYGDNEIWVSNKNNNLVYRIDPTSNAVTATIRVGRAPEAISVGFGKVWVGNALDATISEIDANSAAVKGTIALRGAPTAIATGFGAVWVVSEAASLLERIEPSTDAALVVSVDSGPSGVAITGSSLWVIAAGQVVRVDPITRALGTTRYINGAEAISADDRSIWVTVHAP